MDAFTDASWHCQRARATAVRDRTAPIVTPRDLIGHLPDPRTFDPRAERAGMILRTVVQLIVCAVPVVTIWAVL